MRTLEVLTIAVSFTSRSCHICRTFRGAFNACVLPLLRLVSSHWTWNTALLVCLVACTTAACNIQVPIGHGIQLCWSVLWSVLQLPAIHKFQLDKEYSSVGLSCNLGYSCLQYTSSLWTLNTVLLVCLVTWATVAFNIQVPFGHGIQFCWSVL